MQDTIIPIRGTIDNLTYYKRNGKFFCRRKSSLNAERIRKDPAYEAQRKTIAIFNKAIKLASCLYKHLPKKQRKDHKRWNKLVKKVFHLLKNNPSVEEAITTILYHEGMLSFHVTSEEITRWHTLILDNPKAAQLKETKPVKVVAPKKEKPAPKQQHTATSTRPTATTQPIPSGAGLARQIMTHLHKLEKLSGTLEEKNNFGHWNLAASIIPANHIALPHECAGKIFHRLHPNAAATVRSP